MRKLPHIVSILLGTIALVLLAMFFIFVYIALGDALRSQDEKTVTLFKILSDIDYSTLSTVFIFVLIFMVLADLIIVSVMRSWRKTQDLAPKFVHQPFLLGFWLRYRSVHILFILLTIFMTIAIAAPSMVMNTFTAIVSISVLVSNLTKKIGTD